MPQAARGPIATKLHGAEPFATAQEVWFWFMQAQQARMDGARYSAKRSTMSRPCEPVDVLRIVDRLYRARRLSMDHLRVLRFYGVRMMPPEPWRRREGRAATLWAEAMRAMEPVFVQKGIMDDPFYRLVREMA